MKWLDLGEIEVTTGTLGIGDCLYFPNLQVQTVVSNGVYGVQVGWDDEARRQATRLRAILKNQTPIRQNRPFDEVEAGFGVLGVCDFEALRLVFETTFTCEDEKKAHYVSHLGRDYGVVRVAGLPMVYAQVGDSIYEIYAYMSISDPHTMIGLEAVFKPKNT